MPRKYPPKIYYYEPHDEVKNGDPQLDPYRFLLWGYRIKATLPRIKLLKFFSEEKERARIGRKNGERSELHGYSVEELAEKVGLSLASAYRAVGVLVDIGLVHKDIVKEKDAAAGKKEAARYRHGGGMRKEAFS